MSSVPLPNKSDTDRNAVDSISKQSGDGTEGTVDSSLNEAPRYQVLCGHHYEYARDGRELDSIVERELRRGVVSSIAVWLPDCWSLRDGQPVSPAE